MNKCRNKSFVHRNLALTNFSSFINLKLSSYYVEITKCLRPFSLSNFCLCVSQCELQISAPKGYLIASAGLDWFQKGNTCRNSGLNKALLICISKEVAVILLLS